MPPRIASRSTRRACTGSINLTGGRIDDVRLKDYRLTVEKDSPTIELLSPSALPNGQYAEIGFVGDAAAGVGARSGHGLDGRGQSRLTHSTPVTLAYTNDKGLTFKRTIAIDDNYMFTISDSVTERGGRARLAVELRPRDTLRQAHTCQHLCVA